MDKNIEIKRRRVIKKTVIAGVIGIVLCCFLAPYICSCTTQLAQSYEQFCDSTEYVSKEIEVVECVRVVDGDTLVVDDNGTQNKVRLIGVDTPESVSSDENKNCKEGEIASDYTKSLVCEGQTLYLTRDVSNTDKYGRLLRYVWLEKPHPINTEDEIKEKMLNARLVFDGYAQAKKYEPDTKLSALFSDLEKHATENNLGVSYKWK